jgi:hypothetical protein
VRPAAGVEPGLASRRPLGREGDHVRVAALECAHQLVVGQFEIVVPGQSLRNHSPTFDAAKSRTPTMTTTNRSLQPIWPTARLYSGIPLHAATRKPTQCPASTGVMQDHVQPLSCRQSIRSLARQMFGALQGGPPGAEITGAASREYK